MRAGIALALLAVDLTAPPDTPSGGIDGIGYVDDGTPVAEAGVSADDGGQRPAPGDGGRSRPADNPRAAGTDGPARCTRAPLPGAAAGPLLEPDGSSRPAPPGSTWRVERCYDARGQEVSYDVVAAGRAAAVAVAADPAAVARRALARLPLPLPWVVTSPPADRDQLVNLPTWLWVEGGWEPRSTTAAVPGVAVTVTATPTRVRWEMGDGEATVCHGPGVAYDPALSAARQSTDCFYTYTWPSADQPGERYRGRATLSWAASYTVSGTGGGGDLGEVSRTSEFALRVAEGQALVTSGAEAGGG